MLLHRNTQNFYFTLLVLFCFLLSFLGLFAVITYAQNIPPNDPLSQDDAVVILESNVGLWNSSKSYPVGESEIKVVKFSEETSGDSAFARIAIDSHPNSILIQRGVDYLLGSQNPDGSWGTNTSTKFVTTVAVLDALQTFDITNPKIDKGLEWLSYYFVDNYDYLTQKLKTVIRGGEATSSVEMLLNGFDDESGGFFFERGYESDSLSTARAIQTLFLAGYKDTGANENYTQSRAVQNLIRAKKQDFSWSVFSSGVSSIPVTSEVVEAISLWRGWSLGGVIVNDTLNPAVAALKASQSENGSWSNDILNTAFAYHAIKISGERPTYDLQAIDYLRNAQEGNGSWNNDFYKTAKVLSALSVSTNSGNFVIKDIIPTSILQTGLDATINIRVYNPGDATISDGKLHILADDYLLGSLDLRSNSISVAPGVTANLIVTLSNTRRFVGNVNFKILFEREGSTSYLGSRYVKRLSFAPDSALGPGVPTYFAVYKNVSNGTPAITWRWPLKTDSYRKNIVVMWRKLGDTDWLRREITSQTATSATLGSLIEGQIYEATVGSLDYSGTIYFANPPAQVKVSSNPTTYKIGSVTGKVKSMEGAIVGAQTVGVNSSSNTVSGANGAYSQNSLPWGFNYVKIVDPLYETFVRKFTVTDNAQTGDLFTGRKPDVEITQFYISKGGAVSQIKFLKEKDENISFLATIKNHEQAQTDTFTIGFYVDNALVLNCDVSSMKKLETRTVSCGTWKATLGTHSIKAFADYKNILEETNETNNISVKTLDVVLPRHKAVPLPPSAP